VPFEVIEDGQKSGGIAFLVKWALAATKETICFLVMSLPA